MSSHAPGPDDSPRAHQQPVTSQTPIQAAKAPVLAYNDKNWAKFRSVVPADFVYEEVATQRRLEGIDAVFHCWQSWAKAFPDSRATFDEEFVSSGGTVVLEVTWRGTHTGLLDLPGGPVAPTNRPISLQGCQVIALRDGQAQSIRQYFDIATLLQQLGMLP
jgi:steroid delta-isomerase-like uncharacterized protein